MAAALSLGAVAEEVKSPAFDQRLTGYDYPFEVQTYGFESQGQSLEMAYMHLPAEEGRPTIVLLHGKNFNGAYWEDTALAAQEAGYGVVMPDQIGFGKSSKPTDYQYSFSQLALTTHELLDSLDVDTAIVVGHSMGGMLASRYALSYPEATERLILINPIGLEDYLDYSTYPSISSAYRGQLNQTPEGIIAYQKQNYYDGAWSADYEALTVPLAGWTRGPDKEVIAYTAALTYDMILTQPVIDDFENISVPTSLIIGTRDTTGPNRANIRPDVDYEFGRYDELGARAAALIPDSELFELEDLGHLPQIEAFDRFLPVFLEALD
ncbi:MAG: alpha/beta hydrolase [Ponticaulis sp.]|nr:alpha/beta hydrolase [Ponticaulis sp.]